MRTTSAMIDYEPPPRITFDRPFLFALVHDPSGVPLVLGVIRSPPPAAERPAPVPGRGAAAAAPGYVSNPAAAVSSGLNGPVRVVRVQPRSSLPALGAGTPSVPPFQGTGVRRRLLMRGR
jgi:hypothetical protein